jgi:uncharacterized iron-regulated protein
MRQLPFVLALVTTACAGSSPPLETPPSPAPEVLDGRSGEGATFEAMVADLRTARAVYVGEHHDRQEDHALQARLYEALLAGDEPWALGLEMVQRPYQGPLDAYVAGALDEAGMLEEVQWQARWGFDFGLFRHQFEAARAARQPIVALNAPQEVTRAVGRGGLDALDPETRAALPELDLGVEAHRAMFEAAMGDHPGMDPAMLANFYAAQTLWDETMAESVAAFLDGDPARRILVVAGLFHVMKGFGVPSRAARRGAEPHRIVVPVGADELEQALEDARNGAPWADYLVPTTGRPDQG